MLIDKTHRAWGLVFTILLLVASGTFAVYAVRAPDGPTGGSLPGLLYGIVGSLLMLFAGLLALRRRVPGWPIGSAQFWLRGHIWLGLLSVVLIFFHSGGRFGGPVETVLMSLLLLVTASGLYGLAVQHVLPRLMTQAVPHETFPQQIPYLCRRLQVEGDLLVSRHSGALDCGDVTPLRDAAYSVAEALGELRNGKEEEDFARFLQTIYRLGPASAEPKANGAAPLDDAAPAATPPGSPGPRAENGPPRPKSKLEMARAAGAAKKAAAEANRSEAGSAAAPAPPAPEAAAPVEAAAEKKPLSPLERARAAGPAKRPAAPANTKSILEQARAAAANRAGTAPEGDRPQSASQPMRADQEQSANQAPPEQAQAAEPAPPAGPAPAPKSTSSILAKARAAGAAKPAGQAAEPAKTKSILEQARAAAAGKRDPAGAPPERPKSVLEQARAAGPAKPGEVAPDGGAAPPPARAAGDLPDSKPVGSVARKTTPAPPRSSSSTRSRNEAAPVPRVEVLRQFHCGTVRPFLDPRASRSLPLAEPTTSRRVFARVRADLPAELHRTLDRLEAFCEERREFLTQTRMHFWLHSWLYVHIPATVALLVLFVAHVLTALRVVPWAF